ncbi:MAG: DUF533 domain-containing protein [Thiolinea sp.]
MSLMGTLGKVAMGIMVAKGVGKLMNSGSSGQSGGGLGGLLGSLTGGAGGSSGGLGGLLGGLTGGQSGAGGGLAGMLGGLAGGQGGAAAGGLGGLLNSLGGGAQTQGSTGNNFGDLFNTALQGNEPEQVTADDEANAELMLRAMISAAKADGQLDDDEKRKITEHLGDISEEEANFVRQELQAPVDLQGLISSVPQGMEQQVYLMSLLGITLDSKEEAVYLDQLAQGLNISQEASNQIHDQLGAPKLYN